MVALGVFVGVGAAVAVWFCGACWGCDPSAVHLAFSVTSFVVWCSLVGPASCPLLLVVVRGSEVGWL